MSLRRSGPAYAHRKHIAGRGVQYRIFREVHQNRQTMALATAEHDEIHVPLARDPHDFRFDVTGLDPAGRGRDAQIGAEHREPLPGLIQQIILDLHGGHEGLAHRFHRYEFHNVQQLHLGADRGGERLRAPANHHTVLGEVDHEQDAAIVGHVVTLQSARSASAPGSDLTIFCASALNASGGSVPGRAPGSSPLASICPALTRPRSALRSVLRRWANAAATTAPKCGLTAKAGSGCTVSLATADQTAGGGWKAPGPTSNRGSARSQGESMTVRRP